MVISGSQLRGVQMKWEKRFAPGQDRRKPGASGSIASHPCKERKDGAPSLSFG